MLKKIRILCITAMIGAGFFFALRSPNFFIKTSAATCTWSGGIDSNWETAGNWSNCDGTAPDSEDDVTIDASTTVNLNATTTVNSLTLGNSGGTTSPILNFAYDAITSGGLIIDDGNLIIHPSANITHSEASQDTLVGRVYLQVQTGNFTLDGTINVDGRGYGGGDCTTCNGYGDGYGYYGESNGGAGGGGHGGTGGNKTTYTSGDKGRGGTTYGSSYRPITLGSGGGAGKTGGSTNAGGDGGGAIKIEVAGTSTINGDISANGAAGSNTWQNDNSGAGSGGAITLITANLAGSADIMANGGAANAGAGRGGGGRIGIEYSGTNTYSGSITVSTGTGTGGAGQPGTSYLEDTTNLDLTIPGDNYSWTKEDRTGDWTFRNLTINGDWIVESTETGLFLITLTGDVNIAENSDITFKSHHTTDTDGVGVYLKLAGDMTIPANSSITADGGGYYGGAANGAGSGSGAGQACIGSDGGGGGGHGGAGGGTNGGGTYDTPAAPDDLGSGGAGGCGSGSTTGGRGGGSIRINTGGTLTINGTVSANGDAGAEDYYAGGGGSGGSIYLTVGTLDGSGVIEANGGAGGDGNNADGDGGGGGLIGITYYVANNWSGQALNAATSTAGGGAVGNGVAGSNGQVTLNQSTPGVVVNLDDSLTALDSTDWMTDREAAENAVSGTNGIGITEGSERIAEFYLYFNGNRNLNSVTADINRSAKKSYFHVPGGYNNIDGYDVGYQDYTLYLPKGPSDNKIYICPNVDSLDNISTSCDGVYTLTAADDNVSTVTAGDQDYWKITGLSSTGGLSESPNDAPDNSNFSISGQENIYAGRSQTIVTTYQDTDGATDLDKLYLKIQNPAGTDIEYYAQEGTDASDLTPTAVTGSDYISAITYDRDLASPTSNDITITWHLTLDWDWVESSNIEFGIKATDDAADDSGYTYTDSDYLYENDLDLIGDITATGSIQGSLSANSWVQGGEVITWGGLRAVYQNTTTTYPADSNFDIRVTDNVGTSATDTSSSGEDINLASTAKDSTDENYLFTFSIVNIPAGGSDVSSKSFTLKVDSTNPDNASSLSPSNNSYTNNSRPTFGWSSSETSFRLQLNLDNTNLTFDNLSASETTNRYVFTKDSTNYRFYTKTSSEWGSDQNDGQLEEGKHTWSLRSTDQAGNSISQTSNLYVDTTNPNLRDLTLDGESLSNDLLLSNASPTITGQVLDQLHGASSSNQIAAGPNSVRLTWKVKNWTDSYDTIATTNLNLSDIKWTDSSEIITDNTLQRANKFADFNYTLPISLDLGEYQFEISAQDRAGNTSTQTWNVQIVTATEKQASEQETVDTASASTDSETTPTNNNVISNLTEIIPTVQETTEEVITETSNLIGNTVGQISDVFQSSVRLVVEVINNTASQIQTIIVKAIGENNSQILATFTRPVGEAVDNFIARLQQTYEIWLLDESTVITNLHVSDAGDDYLVIQWETNHLANSKVSYGSDRDYGQDVIIDRPTRQHQVVLANLNPGKKYYFEVMSQGKNYTYDAWHEVETSDEGDVLAGSSEVQEKLKQQEKMQRPTLNQRTAGAIVQLIAWPLDQLSKIAPEQWVDDLQNAAQAVQQFAKDNPEVVLGTTISLVAVGWLKTGMAASSVVTEVGSGSVLSAQPWYKRLSSFSSWKTILSAIWKWRKKKDDKKEKSRLSELGNSWKKK